MDQQAFDRLTRLLSQARSRRETIGALLGAAIPGIAVGAVDAKKGGNRSGRGHGAGKAKRQTTRGEQIPANCYPGTSCIPGKGKNNSKCDFSDSTMFSGKNVSGSNISKANFARADLSQANFANSVLREDCFVDADLTDVNLKSASLSGSIFCRTVMPDGSINNSGCNQGTTCCPTCVPLGGQRCALGGDCCGVGICDESRGDQGVCVCPDGAENCNGTCRDVQSDNNNCGACGNQCGANETCVDGQCTCNPGTIVCDGQCVVGNCCDGANGVTCQSGVTCCAPNGCKDLKKDPANCSACGVPCDATRADACVDGICVCGTGDECPEGSACSSGACGCGTGKVLCEDICQTCTALSGGTTPTLNAGPFCCAGDFCSCGGQCCKDLCFVTEDSSGAIVDEFCCTAPGKVFCVSADGRDEACCLGDDTSVCDACLIGEAGGRTGSYRRPGR